MADKAAAAKAAARKGTRIFELSTLDQFVDRNYTTFLYWFKLDPNVDIHEMFDHLRRGMALTLTQIPLLSGRIKTIDAKKNFVQIEVNDRAGLPMTMRNLSSQHGGESEKWVHGNLADLERKRFPAAAFNDPILRPPDLQSPEGAPVMVVQATFIDGGMALYAAKSHVWCDGGAGSFMYQLWAKNTAAIASGEQVSVSELGPEAFERKRLTEVPEVELPIPIPDDVEEEDTSFGGPDPSTQFNWIYTTWYISADRLKALKAYATSTSGDSWVSTGDAVNALFWRSISTANKIGEDEDKDVSKAAIAVDFRSKLVPKLPRHYIGNAATALQTEMDAEDLVKSGREGLQAIALNFRETTASWDAESEVMGQIGLLNAAKKLTPAQRDMAVKLYACPDVLFADHSKTGCYHLDFGKYIGLPARLRELPQYGLAKPISPVVNVYPLDRNGDAEIKTNLEPHTLQAMFNDAELLKWVDIIDPGMDTTGRSTYKARL